MMDSRDQRNTYPARGLAIAAALSLAVVAGAVAEETLSVDAATVSASSPSQWVFAGAEVVAGASGPEIELRAAAPGAGGAADLYLSFDGEAAADDAGRWRSEASGPYARSPAARFGGGAGSFRAPDTKLTLQPAAGASFAPDQPLRDLSLEFWIKPTRAESGEIVFLWKANRRVGKAWLTQQISCIILRNRVVFGFLNFFAAPDGKPTTFSLQGAQTVVPGAWSHHLVRFDSSTGLLEYLMNGEVEAVAYATSTTRQSGSVFYPVPGGSGRLELAPNYTGLMDEFRIVQGFVEEPALRRYPAAGGAAVSPIFDLGATNSAVLGIDATVRSPGEAAVQWLYRTGDSSAGWRGDDPEWVPFVPGAGLAAGGTAPKGRYIQLRMELFPDAAGERSPSVSSIRVRYEPDRAPSPPGSARAAPGDNRVAVSWTPVSEYDIEGYVVYYGLSSGDYFGAGASEGPSPIFVRGAKTSGLTLHGLKNGTLYFIAVAAYDGANPPHIGESSREISARPSRVSP